MRRDALSALDEAWLEQQVLGDAHEAGWLAHHIKDSRRVLMGDAGFPDWVFARAGRIVIAELKREAEYPGAMQRRWLEALGWDPDRQLFLPREVLVTLWRPTDWDSRIVREAFR